MNYVPKSIHTFLTKPKIQAAKPKPKIKISKMPAAMNELGAILRLKRASGSETERKFVETFIDPIKGMQRDGYGNRYLRIGTDPRVAHCCHTDTVHKDGGTQPIYYDAISDQIFTDQGPGGSDCLGADDGSGIWLMLEMIKAGIEGLYIFHRDEEIGGLGSQYVADHRPDILDGIDIAIAYDRKSNDSIITHQFGGRCASDGFANDLAALLGNGYRSDDTGSFTDTANYTHLVPECTNLSVGYMLQHSSREYQSVGHLLWLRDRLIDLDWQSLKPYRDPYHDDSYADWSRYDDPLLGRYSARHPDPLIMDWDDAYDYVLENPDECADIILEILGPGSRR